MRRAHALRLLSRDHHEALAIALRLRRAKSDTMARDRSAFLGFWHTHGRDHFRIEEELLLPAYAAHGDRRHPLVERVLADHTAIRGRVDGLEEVDETPVWALRQLGEQLGDHVRMEERHLFPLIEKALPAADLERLAAALEQAEPRLRNARRDRRPAGNRSHDGD
jgi:hemerythrin-like domain-containing protein